MSRLPLRLPLPYAWYYYLTSFLSFFFLFSLVFCPNSSLRGLVGDKVLHVAFCLFFTFLLQLLHTFFLVVIFFIITLLSLPEFRYGFTHLLLALHTYIQWVNRGNTANRGLGFDFRFGISIGFQDGMGRWD
ncbi:hypothetical protein DFH27DRAFT_5753 [Peziza echinospora]|nr:hypothetical protein DFH27DRAFT_5753 [Peziza echinospora]